MKKRNILAVATLIILGFTSCSKSDIEKNARVVYEESFNGSSAWYKGTTDGYTATETDGKYTISQTPTGYRHSYLQTDIFTGNDKKQIVEYHVKLTSGKGAASFIVNRSDGNNFSRVYLSQNGKITIGSFRQGNFSEIIDWTLNSNININQQSVIKLELENDALSVYSNGTKIYTWNNPGFTTLNKIGVGVSTWESPTTTVEVDKIRALVVN